MNAIQNAWKGIGGWAGALLILGLFFLFTVARRKNWLNLGSAIDAV